MFYIFDIEKQTGYMLEHDCFFASIEIGIYFMNYNNKFRILL